MLGDALAASQKAEADIPVKAVWMRVDIAAELSMQILLYVPLSKDWTNRRQRAAWKTAFCFSFRGGTLESLWPRDFDFKTNLLIFIKPDVLKCTRKDRKLNL